MTVIPLQMDVKELLSKFIQKGIHRIPENDYSLNVFFIKELYQLIT